MSMPARNLQIVVFLTALLVVSWSISPAMGQSEKLGLLRIVDAKYLPQVPVSYSFSIELKVEYAFRDYFEIHVGVYEGAQGDLRRLLWESETERLAEVGTLIYEVPLESPAREGQWVVTGYVFYSTPTESGYFTDAERGPGFYEMTIKVADNAKVTIRSSYGNVPVWIDGAEFSTDSNGILAREFKVLTEHVVEAPENVSIGEGRRAIFQAWDAADHSNPKTIFISGDLTLTMDFREEFYLDLVSNVDGVQGEGWYRSGIVANFSASPVARSSGWEGYLGVQWRFASWSGDVESTALKESIVMDQPHQVIATWNIDYEMSMIILIVVATIVTAGLAIVIVRRFGKAQAPAEEPATPEARSYCMFCGSEIDADAKFCLKCGRSQVKPE